MVKRLFQWQLFQSWPWLHYDEDRDFAFCFTYVTAYKNKQLHTTPYLQQKFIYISFLNWKSAEFANYEGSLYHNDCADVS